MAVLCPWHTVKQIPNSCLEDDHPFLREFYIKKFKVCFKIHVWHRLWSECYIGTKFVGFFFLLWVQLHELTQCEDIASEYPIFNGSRLAAAYGIKIYLCASINWLFRHGGRNVHALNTPFAISFLSIIRREVYIPKQIHRDKLNKGEESLFRKIIGAKKWR